MITSKKTIKTINILFFYLIVVFLSLPFNYGLFSSKYIYFTHGSYLEYWPYLPASLGTLIASLIFYRINKKNIRTMSLLGKRPFRNIVFAVIPLIVFSIAGIKNYYDENIYKYGFAYCIINFLYAIAEEICWRGYLNDSLFFVNKYIKYSLTGILWWGWHLRFSNKFELLAFPFFCIMASFLMGTIADKTKSYLTVGGIHLFFMILTSNSEINVEKLIISIIVVIIWIIIEIF